MRLSGAQALKSTFDEMWQIEEFRQFVSDFSHSANFAVASQKDDWPLRLCLAYAFKAGLQSRQLNAASSETITYEGPPPETG